MSSGDRTTQLARLAYLGAAWVFLACLVVQLFLVGLDLFEALGDASVHREFAYLYGWLAPALVLLAGVGRLPGRRVALTALLLVLFAVQTYLPSLADRAPLLAAFHAVNALAIFWLTLHLAVTSRDLVEPLSPSGG
jgi:mercuric ion transport protein